MLLLLDEMMPSRFARFLAPEMEAITVRRHGWASKANGELLDAAQHEFNALVTMDRGMEHQRNLARFDIAVVLVRARSNRPRDLAPSADATTDATRNTSPGTLVVVEE
jgi:predicted nuclease of predicted toxin-antitoxin system